jgi:hypothetical protein
MQALRITNDAARQLKLGKPLSPDTVSLEDQYTEEQDAIVACGFGELVEVDA